MSAVDDQICRPHNPLTKGTCAVHVPYNIAVSKAKNLNFIAASHHKSLEFNRSRMPIKGSKRSHKESALGINTKPADADDFEDTGI